MTQEQTAASPPPARPRPTLRQVAVKRVERITPGVVRVTLAGDALAGFEITRQAGHVRIWFPQAGRAAPLMPQQTDNGPVMPEGVQRPDSRVYTPRIWDPSARELSVDFIVHGSGPGSTWAEAAKPGDRVVMAGPGGRFNVDPEAAWYLLGADQTGLPGLVTVLEALPASIPAQVFVEVEDASEVQPLPAGDNVRVTWLHRKGAMGEALRDAIAGVELPADPRGRVWVAAESSIVHAIRRGLLERGIDRTAMHTHGYWKQGEVNHPDHDYGEDA